MPPRVRRHLCSLSTSPRRGARRELGEPLGGYLEYCNQGHNASSINMMFDSMNFCVRAFEDDVGHTKADVRVGHTKADVRAGSSEQQRNGEPRSQLCGVVGSCGIGSNLCAGNKRGAATAAIMGIANMNLGMSFVINSGDAGAGDAGEWRRGRGRRGRTCTRGGAARGLLHAGRSHRRARDARQGHRYQHREKSSPLPPLTCTRVFTHEILLKVCA